MLMLYVYKSFSNTNLRNVYRISNNTQVLLQSILNRWENIKENIDPVWLTIMNK